jgi:RNA polymerase-binding transcription factor DksA
MQPDQEQGTAPRAKATAAQILGGLNRPARVKPEWQPAHDALVELRTKLIERVDERADSAREEMPVLSLHMADAGTDEFDRDFALSLMSGDQNAVYEIEQALHRMRTGTYGICEVTGEPIEPERLAAIPWARYSARAQTRLEASGDVHRTRLASRGSLDESSPATSSESEEASA